jgi:hypothetical protein
MKAVPPLFDDDFAALRKVSAAESATQGVLVEHLGLLDELMKRAAPKVTAGGDYGHILGLIACESYQISRSAVLLLSLGYYGPAHGLARDLVEMEVHLGFLTYYPKELWRYNDPKRNWPDIGAVTKLVRGLDKADPGSGSSLLVHLKDLEKAAGILSETAHFSKQRVWLNTDGSGNPR